MGRGSFASRLDLVLVEVEVEVDARVILGPPYRGVPFDLAVSCCGGVSRCAYHGVNINQ